MSTAHETEVNLIAMNSSVSEGRGIVDDLLFIEVTKGKVEPTFTVKLSLIMSEIGWCEVNSTTLDILCLVLSQLWWYHDRTASI